MKFYLSLINKGQNRIPNLLQKNASQSLQIHTIDILLHTYSTYIARILPVKPIMDDWVRQDEVKQLTESLMVSQAILFHKIV